MIIKTDPAIIAGYLEDASGFLEGRADKLVIPDNEAEVAAYLAEASSRHEPVTVSGGGTGVTAGRIPRHGTLMSLERLDKIGVPEITPKGGRLIVGPGVRLDAVKAAAARAGMLYAPDPTERTGTLGGNVATNASGGQSYKYGPTRDHVLGLSVVLSTGEIVSLPRGRIYAQGDRLRLPLSSGRQLEFNRPSWPQPAVSKNAAGYFTAPGMDAADLFIGMEGTLGVVTEITLRLLPAPAGIFSLVAFFPAAEPALACANLLRDPAGAARFAVSPASVEFMDRHALELLRPQFPNIPAGAAACLLFEQEFTQAAEAEALGAWTALLDSAGVPAADIWFAGEPADREKLREFRHALPETVNAIVRQRRLPKVGTDLAVPAAAFNGMFEFYRAALQASRLEYLIFGHLGDCHLHVNVLPRDQAEYDRARELYLGFAAEAVRRGGTISAEHGVGKLKHEFLRLMVGERGLREMVRVKRALDPALILNRGNIFPEGVLDQA